MYSLICVKAPYNNDSCTVYKHNIIIEIFFLSGKHNNIINDNII